MIPAVLRCENCGAPVPMRAPRCAYCNAPQHWENRVLDVLRGPLVERLDCTRDTVTLREPEANEVLESRVPPSARGLERSWEPCEGRMGRFGRAMRNAVVIVEGEALDAGAVFGPLQRAQDFGGTSFAYALSVCPGRRAFMIEKLLSGPGGALSEELAPWQVHTSVRPVGERNRVELRAADSLLVALVNDVPVARIENADLGFGVPGWYFGAEARRPGTARIWGVELYRAG